MKNSYLIIFVILLALLVHASFINNGFTWLDHGDIEGGRAILPPAHLPAAFFTRFGETHFYRPLVTVINSLDSYIYKNSPQGFHLTNIFLFLLLIPATYFFVRSFFELTDRQSIFVSLITGIHPLTILPVGAISYRQEILVVIFTFAATTAYIEARKSKKIIWLTFSLFSWLLALLSKETAFFWVPALICYREWSGRFDKKKYYLPHFIVFLLTVIFYISLRIYAVPQFWTTGVQNLNFNEALGTRLNVLFTRLVEIVSPLKPNFSDATLITNLIAWKPVTVILILIAGLTVVLTNKRNSLPSRLVFFVMITLLPALSIIPLPRFNSPHYSFITVPAAGVIIILMAGYFSGKSAKTIIYLLIGVWLLIMTVNTFYSGFRFKNDYTLFNPEVAQDVNFREADFYLGDYYLRQGKFDLAESHLEASLEKNPNIIAFVDRKAAVTNLAGVYLSQRKFDQAKKKLMELIKQSSGGDRLRTIYNLAVIAERQNKYQEVVEVLQGEINQWQNTQVLLLYVKGLVKTGNENKADEILRDKLLVGDEKKREELIREIR